eukprot:5378605-Prymnesium_polylepis.1
MVEATLAQRTGWPPHLAASWSPDLVVTENGAIIMRPAAAPAAAPGATRSAAAVALDAWLPRSTE